MLRYFGALPAGRRAGERNRINCRGCCDALRQSFIFRLPAECTAQASGSERVGFSLPVVCILLLCFAEGGFCVADNWRKSVRFGCYAAMQGAYRRRVPVVRAGMCGGGVEAGPGFSPVVPVAYAECIVGKVGESVPMRKAVTAVRRKNVSATGCREEVGMLFGTVAVGLHPASEREKAFSVFMRRCGREPKRG